jgi:hypothetical protein
LCNHIPEQVYQKYTPEKERPSIHGGILRYGGSKVHENICTNRPVPNGTLGGVRGSDDTYSIVLRTNEMKKICSGFPDAYRFREPSEIQRAFLDFL